MIGESDVPATYGRAHPLGQPVIRMMIESFRRPFSSQIFSTLPTRMGRYWKERQNKSGERKEITYPL